MDPFIFTLFTYSLFRRATDLDPMQPLLRKYIGFLEAEVSPAISDMLRPRMLLESINVWNGFKTLYVHSISVFNV